MDLKPPVLGLDYEWDIRTGEPSIIGISDGITTVSVPHEDGHPYLLDLLKRYPDIQLLGHNFIGAELSILKSRGVLIRPEQILDSILMHYLINMNLCKGTKATEDEDEGRGRGFMNLYAMCALYTEAPNWKMCVGEEQCEHECRPCPEHRPFDYNGNDAYWPLKALPRMQQVMKLRGVDKLYPLHRDLSIVLQKVKERGVMVDVEYADKLRTEFKGARAELEKSFAFNPNSPQQVKKHFNLPDAQEETVRDAAEGADESSEIVKLLEYKELGKGADRWFAHRTWDYAKNRWKGYVDDAGFIHCSLGFFTSTGRFNCSNPNLQNVARRRKDRKTGESLGKRVRRAIVAPDGYLLYRADYKAAEYRTFLTLAGYPNIPEDQDFHLWLSKVMGIQESDSFAMSLGGPREAAKSVIFGTIYLEGLKLVEPSELHRPRFMNEVAKGARLVFPEWKTFGKVVTFTGINLARRALAGASLENRAKALDYVQRIFAGFPDCRKLQMKITRDIEMDRAVRTPTGYVCASYGHEEDRLKAGAAMHGSNPVAQYIKYAMLRADSHPMLKEANVLSVHDEALFICDARHEPKKVAEWIREVMVFPLPEIPELQLPIEISFGRNWADQVEIV